MTHLPQRGMSPHTDLPAPSWPPRPPSSATPPPGHRLRHLTAGPTGWRRPGRSLPPPPCPGVGKQTASGPPAGAGTGQRDAWREVTKADSSGQIRMSHGFGETMRGPVAESVTTSTRTKTSGVSRSRGYRTKEVSRLQMAWLPNTATVFQSAELFDR